MFVTLSRVHKLADWPLLTRPRREECFRTEATDFYVATRYVKRLGGSRPFYPPVAALAARQDEEIV